MNRVLQIIRDGHERESSLNLELLPGEQGNLQTLDAMKEIVLADRIEPDLRRFVLREVIGKVPGHDAMGEVNAIFEFARDRITYRQDPVGVERVADAWSTLYGLADEPEGDCGIKSTFLATCLAMFGYRPYFVVIKQRANSKAYNHVYVAVEVEGEFVYLDPTPEDKPAGWQAPHFEIGLFPIFD